MIPPETPADTVIAQKFGCPCAAPSHPSARASAFASRSPYTAWPASSSRRDRNGKFRQPGTLSGVTSSRPRLAWPPLVRPTARTTTSWRDSAAIEHLGDDRRQCGVLRFGPDVDLDQRTGPVDQHTASRDQTGLEVRRSDVNCHHDVAAGSTGLTACSRSGLEWFSSGIGHRAANGSGSGALVS